MGKTWVVRRDVVEKDLSYKLVGIFFKIHNQLGRFCREVQYGNALAQEMTLAHLKYHRERTFAVAGRMSNRVDFMVEEKIIIDIKAKPAIDKDDYKKMTIIR